MKRPEDFRRFPGQTDHRNVDQRRGGIDPKKSPIQAEKTRPKRQQGTQPRRSQPVRESAPMAATVRHAQQQLAKATRDRRRYERAEMRRFTQRTRAKRRTWIIALSGMAALLVFVIGGAYSPLMALHTVHIEGASRIDPAAVRNALASHIGQPLSLVTTDIVRGELEHFTLIQSLAVESRPPNTLMVRIIERVPVGVLPNETSFNLVDSAGVVIESTQQRQSGYPLIQANGGVQSAGFGAATAVLRTLPPDIRSRVDTISATTVDDVTLGFVGGSQRVVWGSPENPDYKALVLSRLLATQDPALPMTIDVSSPDSAIVRHQ
jgi:cell division protein FtsQ